MTSPRSVFLRTSQVYENVRLSSLISHEIDFPPASQVMLVSSRLFHILDRADPDQAEVSRRLWVLKSSILFTFLPFNDPDLRLQQQMNELAQSSTGLPDAAQLIDLHPEEVRWTRFWRG